MWLRVDIWRHIMNMGVGLLIHIWVCVGCVERRPVYMGLWYVWVFIFLCVREWDCSLYIVY